MSSPTCSRCGSWSYDAYKWTIHYGSGLTREYWLCSKCLFDLAQAIASKHTARFENWINKELETSKLV